MLAVACASALVFFHLPLPWDADDPLVLPPIYLLGVWLSIVLAIGVTSLYAFQVTEEARKLSDALAATELVLTREQHLTQLDGLAAAAAHELGTPLSTIVLISRELEKTGTDTSIWPPTSRPCASRRSAAATSWPRSPSYPSTGAPFDRMPLSTLIEETVAPHRDFGVAIKVRIAVAATREPVGTRNPAILYGVGNILENAVDFARNDGRGQRVVERRNRRDRHFRRRPGHRARHAERIGEPYLSRRRSTDEDQSEHRGLGLGHLHRPHAAGTHRRQGLVHQPEFSRPRRRGADRLAARAFRGQRNRSRNQHSERSWLLDPAMPDRL